jgi:DNA polymerase-1
MWDVYWTAQLVDPLLRDARELGQLDWWDTHGAVFQHAVLAMGQRGLLVDGPALVKLRTRLGSELHGTDQSIRDEADAQGFTYTDKFPNSRAQVADFLFNQLELKPSKRTAKGTRPSVDQDSLTRVLRDLRKKDEPHRWVLMNLFHRTRLSTLLTRYLKVDTDADGRVRPVVKMNHVKTWRLAYAKPALQQWPWEVRHIIVARPGYAFIVVDHSQLEARILAYYSGDEPSIQVFEAGGDPHRANAGDLFNIPVEEVTGHARGYAKTWLYRQIYGGTAATGDKKLFCPCPRCASKMPSTLDLKPSEATHAEERWHARHPAVKLWQRGIANEVRATHRFPLLLGGYRYLASEWSRDLERELKNIPMQSGGARIMIRSQNQLHQIGAPIVMQHHDSFMLEVPEDDAPQWAKACREVMEQPVSVEGRNVTFPVDVKVGRNWGPASGDNPDGLRDEGKW